MDEHIKELIEKFDQLDVNALKREGKDFDFTDIHPFIVESVKNIKNLKIFPKFWNYLPQDKKADINANLTNLWDHIELIQKFNPLTDDNPQHQRNSIVEDIRNNYNWLFDHLFPVLNLHVLENTVSSQEIQEEVEKIQKLKRQAEKASSAIMETSAVTGVSSFAGVFGEQAKEHQKSSSRWLKASIGAAIIMGALLVWVLLYEIKPTDELGAKALQNFLTKFLFISFFSIVFYQIVKNYNANKHLYTLNKHRENSLKTFQTFVESTNDPKTKDAVLIQATRSIFEAGNTGYISPGDSTTKGMETLKIVDQVKED